MFNIDISGSADDGQKFIMDTQLILSNNYYSGDKLSRQVREDRN